MTVIRIDFCDKIPVTVSEPVERLVYKKCQVNIAALKIGL